MVRQSSFSPRPDWPSCQPGGCCPLLSGTASRCFAEFGGAVEKLPDTGKGVTMLSYQAHMLPVPWTSTRLHNGVPSRSRASESLPWCLACGRSPGEGTWGWESRILGSRPVSAAEIVLLSWETFLLCLSFLHLNPGVSNAYFMLIQGFSAVAL